MPPDEPNESRTLRVARDSGPANLRIAGIAISHADRLVFPDAGVTKGDLAAYYDRIAPLMLPHCAERPLSLVRLPEGLGGESFFQKHAGKGFPAAMRQAMLPGEPEPVMYVTDAAGLVAGAQMGTVEYHVRGVRRDRPDRPDRLVFDLDPDEGLGFAAVRDAAFELRDRLAALGLPTWALLTGGKGIHVIADLRRTVDWPVVTLFARTFAHLLEAEQPDRYVAGMSKARRSGKIFVDWLRNQPQSTAISAFSLRARPGATVAMPVSWAALPRIASAAAYDIHSAAEAAAGVAPQRAPPVSLTAAAKALAGG